MISSEFAWSAAYGDMDGVDSSKVPQCTEDLMLLIRGITGEGEGGYYSK
jgi:hypothetical protein